MKPLAPTGPVVVGIDGSQAAVDAARWAADQAAARGVALRLVHVIDVEDEMYRDLGDDPAEVARDWPETESGRAALFAAAAAVQDTGKTVDVETEILWGEIDSMLIEQSRHATTMCVGSTGISSLARSILGSTAASLAEQAHSAVAVIRSPHSAPKSEPDWIVAVVDDSPSSDSIIDYALEQAHLRGAPVLALAVSRPHYEGNRVATLEHRMARWRRDRPTVHLYPDIVAAADLPEFLARHDEFSMQLAVIGSADAEAAAAIVGPHRHTRRPHSRCSVLVVR